MTAAGSEAMAWVRASIILDDGYEIEGNLLRDLEKTKDGGVVLRALVRAGFKESRVKAQEATREDRNEQ